MSKASYKPMRGLGLALCLLALSCGGGPRDTTSFKLAQPQGQKSVYAMKVSIKEEDFYSNASDNETTEQAWDVRLETEVMATEPDGRWTLLTRITGFDARSDDEEETAILEGLPGTSFSTVIDKQGRILDVPPSDNSALSNDIKLILIHMNPTMLMPATPVKAGESWPINVSHPVQKQHVTVVHTIKGAGTLKEVKDGQALIDFKFTSELSMPGPESEESAPAWRWNGQSSVSYDLKSSRFIKNKTDMDIEVEGEMVTQDPELVKARVNRSIELSLVPQQ